MVECLYHYYEKSVGPFVSLSGLSTEAAMRIQAQLDANGKTFHAGMRSDKYYERRRYLEGVVRRVFMEKGGAPLRDTPHYMVVGACPWLATWFEDSGCVKIPLAAFDPRTLSFTYGDMFPTFSPHTADGLAYRGQVWSDTPIDRYKEAAERGRDVARGGLV